MHAASKWLQCILLLDETGWSQFARDLDPFLALVTSSLVEKESYKIPFARFINELSQYQKKIFAGEDTDGFQNKQLLSIALTRSEEDFTLKKFPDERVLVRARIPLIQFRPIFFRVAEKEIKLSSSSYQHLFGGIEIRYPQLFQDGNTKEILNALTSFPNGHFFKEILRWSRKSTTLLNLRENEHTIKTHLRIAKALQKEFDQYLYHQKQKWMSHQ